MRRLWTPSFWGTQSRTRQTTFEPTSTSCETSQATSALAFRHNLQRQFFQILPQLPTQIFAFQRKLHRSFEETELVASIVASALVEVGIQCLDNADDGVMSLSQWQGQFHA